MTHMKSAKPFHEHCRSAVKKDISKRKFNKSVLVQNNDTFQFNAIKKNKIKNFNEKNKIQSHCSLDGSYTQNYRLLSAVSAQLQKTNVSSFR